MNKSIIYPLPPSSSLRQRYHPLRWSPRQHGALRERHSEVREQALKAAGIALGAGLLEPGELAPGVPLDDIVRHGDEIIKGADNLVAQIHHFATNKDKTFPPRFKEIVSKFGLDLDDA
ncbi:MAG TPA: hypothetical protein VNK49_14960 [Anaerolineales bacterium]|nr:hypothetical protein [Anaerolineales bacterium]